MSEDKTVYIKTYGCQMNVYDSGRMTDALAPAGYRAVDSTEDADLVILNTCHIREKAAEKVYSELGRLRVLKEERAATGRALRIGVAGCVAQAEGEEILRRAPVVDLVVGPQSYHRLPEMLAGPPGAVATDFAVAEKFRTLPAGRSRGASAFLTVQEGCNRFCTFCVVPYTRGAETSRPVAEVLDEARRLAAGGVREVTLLGQNVNAYHGTVPAGGTWSLGRLLRALAGIPGLDRLRYTTSHPRDMDDELISAHAELAQLMPYLHLPVQSGSDRILAAMNRRHTADAYLRLVERIRAARPDIALTSDFIVGFPGETEDDFLATLAIVDAADYAAAYTFKYSPRPGTPAAGRTGQVAEPVKTERLRRLQAAIEARQQRFAERLVGRELDVLFERPGRRPGQLIGRSPYLQSVHATAPADVLGSIRRVRIDAAGPHSLAGTLLPGGEIFAPAYALAGE